jgi:chromate reductase
MTEQVKLVTILGSLRRASFNGVLARALPALAPEGVVITAAPSLRDIPLYDADAQAAGIPAAVAALGAGLAAADGVIFVSPEYNYSVPGVLKNAIDWISRLSPQPLAGKPASIITASMGVIGGARCQYHLRQTLVFLDMHVMNKPEVMVGTVQNKVNAETGSITDAATSDFIKAHLAALAIYARRVRA